MVEEREVEREEELPLLFLILTALMLGIMVTFVAPVLVSMIADPSDSLNWPSTTAEIVVSRKIRKGNYRIVCAYVVNDERYESENLCYGSGTLPPHMRDREEQLERLRIGENIAVYYDPSNPRDAVLYRGDGRSPLHRLTSGGLIVFFFLFSGLFGLGIGKLLISKITALIISGLYVNRNRKDSQRLMPTNPHIKGRPELWTAPARYS